MTKVIHSVGPDGISWAIHELLCNEFPLSNTVGALVAHDVYGEPYIQVHTVDSVDLDGKRPVPVYSACPAIKIRYPHVKFANEVNVRVAHIPAHEDTANTLAASLEGLFAAKLKDRWKGSKTKFTVSLHKQ